MINQTRAEAAARVLTARGGSLAGDPSLEYLRKLCDEIEEWSQHAQAAWRLAVHEEALRKRTAPNPGDHQ